MNTLVKMVAKNDFRLLTLLVYSVALAGVTAVATNCSDGTTCSQGSTCCPRIDERTDRQANRWWSQGASFGCCPLPNAVCCPKSGSCCPSGFECDDERGICTSGPVIDGTCSPSSECSPCPPASTFNSTSNECEIALSKVDMIPQLEQVKNSSNLCPGGEYRCPEGDTCCQLEEGKFGCCTGNNAVCCDDHVHCCPNGYECLATACKKITLM